MPEAVHNALIFVNGLDARVIGYIAFLADEYPPIGLERASSGSGGTAPDVPPAPLTT
jgi:hypothetical protein